MLKLVLKLGFHKPGFNIGLKSHILRASQVVLRSFESLQTVSSFKIKKQPNTENPRFCGSEKFQKRLEQKVL
jgi:hypothetical protein